MMQRKNAGGERRGEGRRGGKPAMQHSLNYSSTSEWVASDRKMERSTKREERNGGKGMSGEGKEETRRGRGKVGRMDEVQGRVGGGRGKRKGWKWGGGKWGGRRRGGREKEGRKRGGRGEREVKREGWRSRLNSMFPTLKSHSHCLLPSLSAHTRTHKYWLALPNHSVHTADPYPHTHTSLHT